ncbi:MAG TPA: TIGR02466 family protein [Steroidobacteraceae bacterium]|nr:TIGR02466 family protein [Steroidobacteraceae bacterium]
MSTESLFPTRVYSARLQARGLDALNDALLRECRRLRLDDTGGRRWSALNYPGGYTSYSSANKMHTVSPTFAQLQRRLWPHVAKFAKALDLDLSGRALEMTDCWVNIMPRGTSHGLHLHPASTLSGTYYVRTPKGCPGLKFEDPRLDRYMAAPPRRAAAARANRPWVLMPVDTGRLVLFESWLRHEVPANSARAERISISFNYSWF